MKTNEYGLVKILIPGLNGKKKVAGKITRVYPDGRVEIKTQQDGYWTVKAEEIKP